MRKSSCVKEREDKYATDLLLSSLNIQDNLQHRFCRPLFCPLQIEPVLVSFSSVRVWLLRHYEDLFCCLKRTYEIDKLSFFLSPSQHTNKNDRNIWTKMFAFGCPFLENQNRIRSKEKQRMKSCTSGMFSRLSGLSIAKHIRMTSVSG